MTWVKGTTTWGALEHLLAQLACGEVADGSAVTVQSSDRWVREVTRTVTDGVLNSTTTLTSATAAFVTADQGSLVIATGVPLGTTIASVTNGTTVVLSAAATATASGVTVQVCTNTIRTPASKDVSTGPCSGRAGYWANLGASTSGMVAGTAGINTVLRQSTICTANPASGNFGRWAVILRVSNANAVAGNYSTAQLAAYSYDLDTGTTYANNVSQSINAAGVVALSGLYGSQSISITDPSGILTVGTTFIRAFTATYMGGIDMWPMWYRSAAAAPTFTVAPPGAAGTDYDVVAQAYPVGAEATMSALSCTQRGNLLHGLGIKTLTGLGAGALYTLSHSMALAKLRIFSQSTGVLSLDVGQSKKDAANSISTLRNCGGIRVVSWLKCFTTPASVSASTAVQYWASITADGIVLACNGDAAATGKLGAGFLCSYVPTDPTYDVLPIVFNHFVADYTADQTSDVWHPATQYGYWGLRRRQDGSEASANRDWQTKWLRAEHMYSTSANGNQSGSLGLGDLSTLSSASPESTGASSIPQLSSLGYYANNNVANEPSPLVAPHRQSKPAHDGKWWLYGYQYGEWSWLGNAAPLVSESRLVRGSQVSRFLYIPESGWANGDELLDSVSGIRYQLLMPDYAPTGAARMRGQANTFYGGMAIAEI